MTKTVTDPSADLEAAIAADRAARDALEAARSDPTVDGAKRAALKGAVDQAEDNLKEEHLRFAQNLKGARRQFLTDLRAEIEAQSADDQRRILDAMTAITSAYVELASVVKARRQAYATWRRALLNESVPTISAIGSPSDDDAGLARIGESMGRSAEAIRAGDHDVLMYATNAAEEFVNAAIYRGRQAAKGRDASGGPTALTRDPAAKLARSC